MSYLHCPLHCGFARAARMAAVTNLVSIGL
jgi:hypothetical protein